MSKSIKLRKVKNQEKNLHFLHRDQDSYEDLFYFTWLPEFFHIFFRQEKNVS